MKRQDILNEYTVSERGIICNPGRFEGEHTYAPYFWEQVVGGCGEELVALGDGGGIQQPLGGGYKTKRECRDLVIAYIHGLEEGRRS